MADDGNRVASLGCGIVRIEDTAHERLRSKNIEKRPGNEVAYRLGGRTGCAGSSAHAHHCRKAGKRADPFQLPAATGDAAIEVVREDVISSGTGRGDNSGIASIAEGNQRSEERRVG